MNAPDRAPAWSPGEGQTVEPPASAARAGALELLLPLWHRKWRILAATIACAAAGFGLSLTQPMRFVGVASFVVQPTLRPSQSAASLLPGLAGLVGQNVNPVDLYVTILRSQTIADRIIDQYQLQQAWGMRTRTEATLKLGRRVGFGSGRREGLVQISVEDDNPERAAAIANQYVEELRNVLRGYTLDEARQRRVFYDAQLERAGGALERAQRRLQTSGFDAAALRAEPRAAAEGYGRLQAEIAAAEVRLQAIRRARADGSPEVQQQLTELAALRAQLGRLEVPKDENPGSFVGRLREFRQAEALFESISRQAESARLDEASDAAALKPLDRARAPEWPSSPRPILWLIGGALLGFGLMAAWVLMGHRSALARLDPAYIERIELLRAVLRQKGRA